MNDNEIPSDEYWMSQAILEAQKATDGDWPFGAVVVQDNKIVSRAYNHEYAHGDASAHAELLAIAAASMKQGHRHLRTATLYTTHEPCTMCSGAILNAKLGRVVIGSKRSDRPSLFHQRGHNVETLASDGRTAHTEVVWGVLHDECVGLFDSLPADEIASAKQHPPDTQPET